MSFDQVLDMLSNARVKDAESLKTAVKEKLLSVHPNKGGDASKFNAFVKDYKKYVRPWLSDPRLEQKLKAYRRSRYIPNMPNNVFYNADHRDFDNRKVYSDSSVQTVTNVQNSLAQTEQTATLNGQTQTFYASTRDSNTQTNMPSDLIEIADALIQDCLTLWTGSKSGVYWSRATDLARDIPRSTPIYKSYRDREDIYLHLTRMINWWKQKGYELVFFNRDNTNVCVYSSTPPETIQSIVLCPKRQVSKLLNMQLQLETWSGILQSDTYSHRDKDYIAHCALRKEYGVLTLLGPKFDREPIHVMLNRYSHYGQFGTTAIS